mgnify:CR=1 FL=1
MRYLIFVLLCTVILRVHSLETSQDCFTYGLQYAGEPRKLKIVQQRLRAGPYMNDPTVDKTPDPESCQLFCQTVSECSHFSWADADYSWEIYANG